MSYQILDHFVSYRNFQELREALGQANQSANNFFSDGSVTSDEIRQCLDLDP